MKEISISFLFKYIKFCFYTTEIKCRTELKKKKKKKLFVGK